MSSDNYQYTPDLIIQRVQRKLTALGLPAVHPRQFEEIVFQNFDSFDFAYAQEMKENLPEHDWHLVTLPNLDQALSYHDPWLLVDSAEDAHAFVDYLIQYFRIQISEIRSTGQQLEILQDGSAVIGIEKVVFPELGELDVKRGETALKDIYYGDEKIAEKFSKGFGIKVSDGRVSTNHDGLKVFVPSPKAWAKHLRSIFSDQIGVQLKQHQACEITAAFFDFDSWHHLTARHHKKAYSSTITAIVSNAGQDDEIVDVYRNQVDGLVAITQRYRRMKINPNIRISLDRYYGKASLIAGDTMPFLTRLEVWSPPARDDQTPHLNYDDQRSLKDNLLALVNGDLSLDERLAISRKQMGISSSDYVRFGDIYLYLLPEASGETRCMCCERYSAGELVQHQVLANSKTSIDLKDGEVVLTYEYGNEVIASLSGASDDDLRKLLSLPEFASDSRVGFELQQKLMN